MGDDEMRRGTALIVVGTVAWIVARMTAHLHIDVRVIDDRDQFELAESDDEDEEPSNDAVSIFDAIYDFFDKRQAGQDG